MTNNLFENQVPFMKPLLGEEEWYAMKDVILGGWVSQGPKVQEFEQVLANFLGVKHVIAMNACTSAMHIGMKIAGVQYGDDVIAANFTCMANVNAIKMAGANPIFVDVDPKTYNIDPSKIEAAITPKTKLVLNIDQIGLPNDIDELQRICDKHNLILLDDAATAFGAKYKGEFLGKKALLTTFSFHPRKMITTGEGGALATNDDKIAENARILRATGASVSDLERHKAKGMILQKYYDSGYNYRMTDMQAAMGIAQMDRIDYIISERAKQAAYYNEKLGSIPGIQIPFVPEYATPAWSSYCLKLTDDAKLTVEEIITKMTENNISVRYGIQPLHQEPFFDAMNFKDDDFPVSCHLAKNTFFIPIFPGLTEKEQNYVVETLQKIMK
jgi:dTDP-4-amino-4,6-dideoxygalactose transaminase